MHIELLGGVLALNGKRKQRVDSGKLVNERVFC